MWKTLLAGTTMLMMAGSTLAFAQQPTPADRAHHTQLTADDLAAFADARFAALKTALKLTPSQEKNWPAVEQALRDISKARTARRQARESVGQQTDPIERLHDRADALTARAEALRRLADAEKPFYQSRRGAEAPLRSGFPLCRTSPSHGFPGTSRRARGLSAALPHLAMRLDLARWGTSSLPAFFKKHFGRGHR